ncbi:unnamed protein product [Bemisia tabaci]|uniref:Peptidase C1A papain C-terminal domain-containing protein n=1 Tax=Bemisia tabaci TaxID=7038 RepID=A0A9P0ALM3_BEMTA|nr:unnamed protein product [Bemisia tabaci]
MRSDSEKIHVWLCVLSGLFRFTMSFDESTIIIPDPARLAREINSAQNSWVAEDYYGRPVTFGDVQELISTNIPRHRLSKIGLSIEYGADTEASSDAQPPSNIEKIYDPEFHSGVSGERAFGSAVHSVRGEGERVHIGRESGHLLQVVRQRLQRWQPIKTFKHFTENGEITGGDYGSQIGCKPYSMPPRDNTATMNIEYTEAKKCENKCTNPKYPIPFEKEKRYKTKNYYLFDDRNTTKIQWDLMLNGPQVGAFIVYSDFLLYSKGVYRHTKGVALGGHGVRLIGWGQEKGVDYWLAANSWGTDWGQKGFFKLRRGANECLLEELVVAGEVDLANIHDSPTT